MVFGLDETTNSSYRSLSDCVASALSSYLPHMNIIRATNFISRSRFRRAIISEFGRDSVWNPKSPNLERISQSGKIRNIHKSD